MRITMTRRSPAPAAFLVLTCAVLAACGSSSSPTATSTSATNATSAAGAAAAPGAAGAPGAPGGGSAAFRQCLAKQGVTLPQPTGTPPSGGGAPPATSGASSSKLRAALQKCGAAGGGPAGSGGPGQAAALTKFAACMRSHGINLPAANTSGSGPVFNTKGLDTTSTAFKTAEAKCSSDLPAGFGRGGPPPGGPTGSGPGGTP